MTALGIVVVTAVVFFVVGTIFGSELQDRVSEDRRRRVAVRQRQVNARFRAMQRADRAAELALSGTPYVVPIAIADRRDLTTVA